MDSCDICGRPSPDLYSVIVEGAHMTVCEKCSKGNKVLAKVQGSTDSKTKFQGSSPKEDETEVIEDYDDAIRKAREDIGLSLEQFALKINEKASGLRRVEEGRTLPSAKLTAKLEKELGIKLTAPAEKAPKGAGLSKDEPITLWDAAYKKESQRAKKGE